MAIITGGSDIRKKLAAMALIGQLAEEALGLLVTKNTKFLVDKEEFRHEGLSMRLHTGDIVALGSTPDTMNNYKVLDVSNLTNTVELKQVSFFKAKVTNGSMISEYCVAAANHTESQEILKTWCINNGYKRCISLNPSKFFEPVIS